MEESGLHVSRKAVLVVLFVPSVERDGITAIDQEYRLDQLGSFCRRMGRESHQGEVGLVIGDEYLAFRDFSQE